MKQAWEKLERAYQEATALGDRSLEFVFFMLRVRRQLAAFLQGCFADVLSTEEPSEIGGAEVAPAGANRRF